VFIPLAEQSDVVVSLGEFALTAATFDAAQWRDVGAVQGGPYITVNLSARQFHDARLFEIVSRVLAESGLAPNRLALEVTEGVALTDIDTTVGVLERLRQLEVVTALDDFGTGYSSLAYLARLRPDVIKIDRSFLAAALDSSFDRRVLESLIALCHRLDMFVLAEGVETVEQVRLLQEMGCALGQGFLFSPAVPSDEVRAISELIPQHWRELRGAPTDYGTP
jgi:EAL domain-containing protein (putative c-di-GMP-specific phosphodiesterase class I)